MELGFCTISDIKLEIQEVLAQAREERTAYAEALRQKELRKFSVARAQREELGEERRCQFTSRPAGHGKDSEH